MSVLKIRDENEQWTSIPTIKGDTGDAAGFGTVTATVDTNVGTPTVTVTSSGENTAKNFAFAFQNLGYDDSDLQADFASVESDFADLSHDFTDLSDDFTDLAGDFATLDAQFQTAVSAVTVDSEVQNIRVGDDGVTYTSAGEAVRTQFANVKSAINDVADAVDKEKTGGIISINDGADNRALNSFVVNIEAVQSGAGTPSPSNVRPFIGWSSANIMGTNENMCLIDSIKATISVPSSTPYRNAFSINKIGTYIVSANSKLATGLIRARIKDVNGNFSEVNVVADANTMASLRFTISEGETLLVYDASENALSTSKANFETAKIQIETGAIASEFKTSVGNTYNAGFGTAGTIYGGVLDVLNGKLTVTKGHIASYNGESLAGEWKSSQDVYAEGATPTIGAEVVYSLSSPIEYDVTPINFKTIGGVNNIWADAGISDIIYYPDLNLEIMQTAGGYVTPQMFGAKADGVTDDTAAFEALNGKVAYIPSGTYIVSHVEYGRKTVLHGAGMGKTIIKQKSSTDADLFDFVNADCSGLTNMTLEGNYVEQSSNIYRALLKIRTTNQHKNFSNYSNFEHLAIVNAPGSGLVMMGIGSYDTEHPSSYYNWVHHINDLRIKNCYQWCLLDETSDNLFSNLYLSDGNAGCLLCKSSSNMYVNLKLDQENGNGYNSSFDGYNDGALVLLNGCNNLRFVNIDVQSAYYVGVKIYNSYGLNFDGDINNIGIGANGHGIGLRMNSVQHSTFNLEFHAFSVQQETNVRIDNGCSHLAVYATEYYKTPNINKCPEDCFIADPSHFAYTLNASAIDARPKIKNLFDNPLCESLQGWSIAGSDNVSIDTTNKTAGANSFKVIGNPSESIRFSQTFNGLKPDDYYMVLADVNIEQLSTNYVSSETSTAYIVMATGGQDSQVKASHNKAPRQLGKHLIAQIGSVSSTGTLEPQIYVYKNDSVLYLGNFALINLSNMGIKPSTYEAMYAELEAVMNDPFNGVGISTEWDYSQIMGIIKYLLQILDE